MHWYKRYNESKVNITETVSDFDNSGNLINPSKYDLNHVYTVGILTSSWFTDGTNTWTKIYTYSGSDLIKVSRWIKT